MTLREVIPHPLPPGWREPFEPFWVTGEPRPQPRPRARVAYSGGKPYAQIYNPHTVDPWRKAIALRASRLPRRAPLLGPILLGVEFFMPRTKELLKPSAPDYPLLYRGRFDIDNMLKACADELTLAGVWRDDRYIRGYLWPTWAVYAHKGGSPGAMIRVAVEEDPQLQLLDAGGASGGGDVS